MGYWRHSYTTGTKIVYVQTDRTAAELTKARADEGLTIKVIASTYIDEPEPEEPPTHLKVVK